MKKIRVICASCGIRYWYADWKTSKCKACGGRLINFFVKCEY